MCRIDGPIAAPSATLLLHLSDVSAKLRGEPAQPRILRLDPRQFAGALVIRSFAISHWTTHPDRKARRGEATPR